MLCDAKQGGQRHIATYPPRLLRAHNLLVKIAALSCKRGAWGCAELLSRLFEVSSFSRSIKSANPQ